MDRIREVKEKEKKEVPKHLSGSSSDSKKKEVVEQFSEKFKQGTETIAIHYPI